MRQHVKDMTDLQKLESKLLVNVAMTKSGDPEVFRGLVKQLDQILKEKAELVSEAQTLVSKLMD